MMQHFCKENWNICFISCGVCRWCFDHRKQWKLYWIHKEIIEEWIWDDIFQTNSLLLGNWSDSKSQVHIHLPQEVCWRDVEQIWHDRVQPSLYSNGMEFEAYIQLVRSLIYLIATRPYISFIIGILSRFMQKPYEEYWSTTKRIINYLKRTQDFGLNIIS